MVEPFIFIVSLRVIETLSHAPKARAIPLCNRLIFNVPILASNTQTNNYVYGGHDYLGYAFCNSLHRGALTHSPHQLSNALSRK